MPQQQILLGAGKGITVEDLTSQSGTWTAPAGVTEVALKLVGTEDHPETWYNLGIRAEFYFPYASWPPDYPNESPTQTSAVALVNTWLAHANSIWGTGTGERTVSGNFNTTGSITTLAGTTHNNILVYSGTYLYGYQTNLKVRGSLNSFTSVTYGQGVGNWAFSNYQIGNNLLQKAAPAQAGVASTFGSYTAAGASIGGSPTTIEQTISVTPGQSYSYGRGVSLQSGPQTVLTGTVQLTY